MWEACPAGRLGRWAAAASGRGAVRPSYSLSHRCSLVVVRVVLGVEPFLVDVADRLTVPDVTVMRTLAHR